MSYFRFFFITIICFFGLNTAWSQSSVSVSGGLPLSYGCMAFDKAYLFEVGYIYRPKERSGFGIGLSHIKSDLPDEGFILTYDRVSTNFYLLYNYSFPLASRFSLLPEAQLGYAFTEGRIGQLSNLSDKASGMSLGANVCLIYHLGNKLKALVGVGFSHVFGIYQVPKNRIIPASYAHGYEGLGTFCLFKTGLIYNFSL